MKDIKSIFTLLTLNFFFISGMLAQAPEKMNYQAVARDISGSPLVSASVNLQFDILQGSSSGTVEYSETQSKTTNQFGLFTAEIGAGTILSGTFSSLSWGTSAYFLRITVNGDVMPATQLLSVPYALYSKTSGGGATGLTAGSGIDITGGVITSIKDTSSINELQVLTTNATNDTVFLSQNGGFVYIPAITGDDWGTDTVNTLGNNILGNGTLANPLVVIDNDTSSTNEYQDLSWNTADSNLININNGTSLALASNNPTLNQVLTWNGANWIAQDIGGGWTQGTGDDIYNNSDSVGIGTVDPKSLLQLGDFVHEFPLVISATEEYAVSAYNTFWDGSTLRNTTGGISGVSIMGDDNGNPVMSWLLYPAQPAGTDMFGANPSLRMNLRSKGLAINSDVGNAGLDVTSVDSAAIFMDVPDDNSQPTLSYRAPGGASEILGLRVPNTLLNSYTLTYPVDLPATAGSSLVSDLNGNLSWGSASQWARTGTVLHPSILTDNVGIGANSATYPLDIKKNQTGSLPLLGVQNTSPTGDAPMLFSTTAGNFMIGADAGNFKIASSNTNLALNTRLMIGTTGNVGVGTTAPTAQLHARSVGNKTALNVVAAGASSNPALTVTSMAGSPAAVFWNGFVGIGSTPTARFHSSGTLRLENLGGTAPAAGSVLTSIDANGNAQWQAPSAARWTGSAGALHPITLADNVGIGTGTPTTKLDVNGDVNIYNASGNPLVIRSGTDGFGFRVRESDNGNDAVNIFGYASRGRVIINDNGTTNINLDANSSLDSYINAGDFGIGLTAPATTLDVLSANSSPVNIAGNHVNGAIVDIDALNGPAVGLRLSNAGTRKGGMMFNSSTNNLQLFMFGSTANDGIFLKDGTYNVGIGTSSPSNKLDVEGAVAIGANYSGTASAPADGLIVEGNVGIGTNSPGMIAGSTDYLTISSKGGYTSGSVASIELKGNTNMANDAASKIDFLNGIGGPNNIARVEARTANGSTAQGQLVFYTNNGTLNERMRITPGGNVGVGTAVPTAMFSVNGTANKPGGGTWTVFSDARSKENITSYNKGLDELLRLRPVSFNYKKEFNWGSKTYVGLIAQEVEKVVPTMVEKKEVNGINDFREVDPNEINYMLINAIKEQQKMIEKLQQEIEDLKK